MTVSAWLLSEAETHDTMAQRWRTAIADASTGTESSAMVISIAVALEREVESARTLRILAKAKQAQHEIPEGA